MKAIQLDTPDSKRGQAIDKLSQAATDLELSYTISGDTMTITLPRPDDVALPIVGTLHVDVDDIKAPDSTGGD